MQLAFKESTARNRLFIGGRGSGKTKIGAIEAISQAWEQPGSRGAILAPTYKMLKDATVPDVLELLPQNLIRKHWRGSDRMEIELVQGSTILFRSLENYPMLANLILAWAWTDEGALGTREAWQLLKARTRQPGYKHKRWITSTPQGRNWLYEEFAEKPRANYEWFQASIYENREHLPEGYIEDLEDSYSGLFARQELLGEFVAFEGLIYDFQRNVHVQATAPDAEWTETIGGIDWGYSQPMAVVVARRGSDCLLHQVDEFYEKRWLVDEKFVERLKAFEADYGDTTWWCDPAQPAYIRVLLDHGIDARAASNKVEPGINAVGIALKVRGDGEPRYKVAPNCINTIAEFETYHRDERDKIVKEKDHLCLAAGTQIETPSGQMPIEMIRAGDMVLTREGYKVTTEAALTNTSAEVLRVLFSDGRELIGTANHPVFMEDKGYTELHALRYGDIIVSCRLRLSNIKESSSAVTPNQSEGKTVSISPRLGTTGSMVFRDSTRRFGKIIMDRYRKVSMSITRMETAAITTRKILSAYQVLNTLATTKRDTLVPSPKLPGLQLPNGTDQRREGHSIARSGSLHGRNASGLRKTVNIVVSNMRSGQRARIRGSAPITASRHGAGQAALMTKSGIAPFAERLTSATSMLRRKPVPIHVVSVNGGLKRRPVYNLTVDGAHNFFANGILVSNCDALRYMIFGSSRQSTAETMDLRSR